VKERIHQRLIHRYVDYPRNKDSPSKRLTTKNVHSSLELEREVLLLFSTSGMCRVG